MAFGINPKSAMEATKAVRDVYKGTLIVKLSPNVTDIADMARIVVDAGADSVSLVNTFLGMAINAETRKAHPGNHNRRIIRPGHKTHCPADGLGCL